MKRQQCQQHQQQRWTRVAVTRDRCAHVRADGRAYYVKIANDATDGCGAALTFSRQRHLNAFGFAGVPKECGATPAASSQQAHVIKIGMGEEKNMKMRRDERWLAGWSVGWVPGVEMGMSQRRGSIDADSYVYISMYSVCTQQRTVTL
ncbi:unnamed protein product [Ceratitis capitata]|uniref:(Mediterranean fruit fly) hypothetical protein n=1 Tax=Ceratitis capitata TaxID=7213 RepID=A0A811V1G8_CERCA|nr:unnamed protein product [Ceratitis capitata]